MAQPPIIIKGGSFSVEVPNPWERRFSTKDNARFAVQPPEGCSWFNVEIATLDHSIRAELALDLLRLDSSPSSVSTLDLRKTVKKVNRILIQLATSEDAGENLEISAAGADLTVSAAPGRLQIRNDGPKKWRHRLFHAGYGNDVGFWVAGVQMFRDEESRFTLFDDTLEYRLRVHPY
jgi:hypothetical protein